MTVFKVRWGGYQQSGADPFSRSQFHGTRRRRRVYATYTKIDVWSELLGIAMHARCS